MHRIDSTNKEVDKFGSGKHGWTEGDISVGTPATETTEDIFDAFQEEIAGVVEGVGATLDKTDHAQLFAAFNYAMKCLTVASGIDRSDSTVPEDLRGVIYAEGVWVIGGGADATDVYTAWSSDGGITWTEVSAGDDLYSTVNTLAHGSDGYFVGCGDSNGAQGLIQTSADGKTWTERANPNNENLNDVAHDQSGLWVACATSDGTRGYLITAPDPTSTWTQRNPTVAVNASLNAIAFGNSIWVSGGTVDSSNAYLITSTDGITWTRNATTIDGQITGLHYDATLGLWVAVGVLTATGPFILTATDPTGTWTSRTVPADADDLRRVTSDGKGFLVAVGNSTTNHGGTLLVSHDGITWQQLAGPNNEEIIYGIAFNQYSGGFMMVGQDGTIVTTAAFPPFLG